MRRILLLALLPFPALAQDTPPDGQALFTLNCSACHLPNQQLVGPSLVEISKLYAKDLPSFLKWCKTPQKKRKELIEMPSMAHLPEDQLTLIHAHILKAAEGLTELPRPSGDPFGSAPTLTRRPNILRTFLPDTGPASIAVAVDGTWSYCWDAGACRLRYVWKGGFLDPYPVLRGNGNALSSIQGTIVLRESAIPLAPFTRTAEPKFLGYQVTAGLPTFLYRLGETTLSERLEAKDGTLQRSFTFSPPLAATPAFTPSDSEGSSWTLDRADTKSLVLTLKQP